MTGDSGGLTLHLEKILQARTERVFAACVEPEKLAEWWGPAGFTSPTLDLDVRDGGRYRITMQPPDGEAFHLRGEFCEVDPPRRLVYIRMGGAGSRRPGDGGDALVPRPW